MVSLHMHIEDQRIVNGLAAQASERRRLLDAGTRRLGWKAGFGTAAAMNGLGTQAPLVGFLTEQTLRPDGATCEIGGWDKPILEPEVAVRLGRDLAPGASREEAAAAIDAVAPAIELVDLHGPTDDVEAILAANIFHRHVLLGAFRPVSDDVRLDAVRLDVLEGDAIRAEGVDATELLGDLADVVRHLADQIPATGDRLQAGDVVITGSAVPAIPVSPGDRITVRAAGLGQVEVRLA
jgi:2-keto-4-pentenoate hydratase